MKEATARPLFEVVPRPATPRALEEAALLSALPVPIAVLDAEDRFRYINPAAEHFFGISAAQSRHLCLRDLLPADNPLFALLRQVRAEGMVVSDHELTLESPRLHRMDVSVQGALLQDEPDNVLVSFQDISAARTLNRQLSFRSAARSVTGMAAILAHEIKNPLSGIRGAAQLLESSVAETDRELAVLIRDEADRIRGLVERIEIFDERPMARAAVNIHRVLSHVRKLAQSGFASHVRFVENYDPSLPPVWGNRDQLVQIVLNLVKNAAESIAASGIDGEIVLTTSFQHGVRLVVPGHAARVHLPLMVCVRDNGAGIPEDFVSHLFDPFVTSKPSGSGLGLALVAKLVADHGGLIEVDGKPGRCEFRLYLPMHAEDDVK